ncbi:WXG100 family type VII secretion target [Nocardia sp. NPDC004068]|uniref:WXG100 family type VII secretion target n=1 Tax=Nocardia sp. NPDC004068 TaxID=3364303 RepID=UPI00367FDE14
MTEDARAFTVDLDKLENLAARIRGFADFIAGQLDSIDQKAKQADGHWTGSAADAYRETHAEWLAGAIDIKEGLRNLEKVVKQVHEGYTGAVADNLRILGI